MRPLRTALATVLAILVRGGVPVSLVVGGDALAQSPADLAGGRQLFVEALSDEEHGRFAAALEKYRRVQEIRDTVNVRYRIGASLEGLGKVARSVDAYSAAIKLGTDNGTDADVVRAAQARLDVLRPRVAHLSLRLPPSRSWPDAEVAVDSEPVALDGLSDLPLDPGPHVVTATAKGASPFRAQISLSEGGRADLPIVLEPAAAAPPPPAPAPTTTTKPYRTIGLVAGAAGGLLMIGGAIVLVLRSSAISELHDSCPNGNCPASREEELRGTRDRALVEGPVGVALLAAGAVAAGTGIVLFTISGHDTKTATTLVPSPVAQGAMITLARGF